MFHNGSISVPQIMKEWAEADNKSKTLPKVERQAMNEVTTQCFLWIFFFSQQNLSRCSTGTRVLRQHFQSVLQTLEEQVASERQRLVETHLVRVEAILNNNRRLALENYLTAVQSDPPQVGTSPAQGPKSPGQ